MKDIAAQLRLRAEPNYIKQKAKEAAVEKSMEWKDRISGSPIALGVIGGLATAAIARMLLNPQPRGYARYGYGRYPVPYEGEGRTLGDKAQELKAKVGEKAEGVKEQAGQLKEQALEQVEHLRERIPSADEVKEKAQELRSRAREYAGEEPLITALGALAIGAALGFLLPLSEPERRLLGPARQQVGARLESLKNEVAERVQGKVEDLQQKIAGDESLGNPPGDIKFPT